MSGVTVQAARQAPSQTPRRAPAHFAPAFRPALPRRPRRGPARGVAACAAASASVEEAVGVLHRAAESPTVPPKELFAAMRALEKAAPSSREDMAAWPATVGGTASPGRRWRLVFTTGTKETQDAMKGRWDASQGEIENGIFLGRLFALTFVGPYSIEGKILAFDFDTLRLRLGPWTAPLQLKGPLPRGPGAYRRVKDSPFFSFFYVDERVIAARGRSGGIAMWARTSPSWELEKGIV
eukprot:scaffold4.g4843.t1